ncbi:YlbL family protein [Xylanimonas oleitrophica]|uniref:YlbL family protein n=1 Tax=Xylanimonas oleitrophica TaxID=2607479 RepID=UPI00319E8D28
MTSTDPRTGAGLGGEDNGSVGFPEPAAPAPVGPRALVLSASLLATALLSAVALVLPTGYAVRAPGPTEDTLGSQRVGSGQDAREMPLVEIEGAETYPASGQLRLTTVSVGGGPVSNVYAGDVLAAWASPARAALPVEAVFPAGVTQEQQREESAAQMTSSQENATAAALTELGYDVPATLTVAGTPEGSGAAGVVEEGDVVRSLDGRPVATHADLLGELDQVTPGDDVVLGVERDGRPQDLTITTTDGGSRAALGILVSSQYDFPIDVSIRIEDIGGPSAGMMFALAIIDVLTPEDELQGQVVAGTGTMDVDGAVGPIGGIEQKLRGAVRDGAAWFLAPADNCPQVVGEVPEGLRVVRVATLAEARDAVEAIGAGRGEALPTCS